MDDQEGTQSDVICCVCDSDVESKHTSRGDSNFTTARTVKEGRKGEEIIMNTRRNIWRERGRKRGREHEKRREGGGRKKGGREEEGKEKEGGGVYN